MRRADVIDRYFMEHRAKLVDIAAFLDRVDRAQGDAPAGDDVRLRALRDAIDLLNDGQGDRARRLLELWSDPTEAPIPAAGGKGAIGVWPRHGEEGSGGPASE
jgi:hypothetical protein